MPNLIQEELKRIEHFRREGKYKKALEVIFSFDNIEDIAKKDWFEYKNIEIDLLIRLNQYEDSSKLIEEVFNKSQRLGLSLYSFDALHYKSYLTYWTGNLEEAHNLILKSEKLLNSLTEIAPLDFSERKGVLLSDKAYLFMLKGELKTSLEFAVKCLEIYEDIGNREKISTSFYQLATICSYMGDFSNALKYGRESLKYGELTKEERIKILIEIADIHGFIGELEKSIELLEEALVLAKEMNAKPWIANILLNLGKHYRTKGLPNKAIVSLEKSLQISKKIQVQLLIFGAYIWMSIIKIEENMLEDIPKYLEHLQQIAEQTSSFNLDKGFRVVKALYLKRKNLPHQKIEAKKLLKQITQEKVTNAPVHIIAIVNLCELLLEELRKTNDIEILEEIKPQLSRLINIAESQKSYPWLVETYMLQAKLSLLTFDMMETRRYLTQAQQVAERHGLNRSVIKIAGEQEKLLKQLKMWEQLKESNALITERIELSQLGEQMEKLVRNKTLLAQVTEIEVTVHKDRKVCLVCKGEIVGFMYVCECDTIYCENCTQALIELENICWVCNAQMDKSKSTKDGEGISLKTSSKDPKEPKH
ncbi:MAG: tetratricopeptide repeat protein [Candidatus Hodarchaeota archaeon]